MNIVALWAMCSVVEINVELTGLDEVVERLRGVQDGARFALRAAIRFGLRRGKTEAGRAARERYNIGLAAIRSSIGNPVLSGLSGFLRVSGSKFPLYTFPVKNLYPGGMSISELKEGPAIILRHAFNAKVYERRSAEIKRLPIMRMAGLSAPQMIGERKQVLPAIQEQLQQDVNTELQRLTRGILSGQITPR